MTCPRDLERRPREVEEGSFLVEDEPASHELLGEEEEEEEEAKESFEWTKRDVESELGGFVALHQVSGSLPFFSRRIAVHLMEEQGKPNPDNGLIALLCDAARLVWEIAPEGKP